MSDLGPGDWVERVRESDSLTVGAVYVVGDTSTALGEGYHGTCVFCAQPDGLVLRLANDPTPDDGEWWCGCGFRPIYRPKGKQLLRDLMQSVKERA